MAANELHLLLLAASQLQCTQLASALRVAANLAHRVYLANLLDRYFGFAKVAVYNDAECPNELDTLEFDPTLDSTMSFRKIMIFVRA